MLLGLGTGWIRQPLLRRGQEVTKPRVLTDEWPPLTLGQGTPGNRQWWPARGGPYQPYLQTLLGRSPGTSQEPGTATAVASPGWAAGLQVGDGGCKDLG